MILYQMRMRKETEGTRCEETVTYFKASGHQILRLRIDIIYQCSPYSGGKGTKFQLRDCLY
jgi:hypothetical protein